VISLEKFNTYRGARLPPSGEMMLRKPFYEHLFPALLVGLGLRLFFIWRFPFASGDTPYYEELARNWLYHGIYGFFSDGHLSTSAVRMPGISGDFWQSFIPRRAPVETQYLWRKHSLILQLAFWPRA
jgi:hypothetical protein